MVLFETALDTNPKIEQFWLSYVDALVKAERPKDAKRAIKQAKKRGVEAKKLRKLFVQSKSPIKREAEACNNLGNALSGMGRLIEAKAHYEQAIALKPDFAEAHFNLGNVLLGLCSLTESKAHYEQAIALKPDFAEAHNNLGITLRGWGF